ncbi:MAG: T4 RnlA family RNA ligase, partial [Tannerella sp.]|nr:T4 RnlA family RNA ligase [Tannerella sp.]
MYLLDFIHHNSDWKEKLQQAPYCLYINEEDNYYLLKYNQFESDFSNMIVRECRGIILRKADLTVCCRAFDKFFNVQEENAAKIDWA